MREKDKWLQVRIDEHQKAQFMAAAADMGIGISELVRRSVAAYIGSAAGGPVGGSPAADNGEE